MIKFDTGTLAVIKKLRTPAKIQDYLNSLGPNLRDTCWSPRMVVSLGRAHCMEGAMLAAAAFWYQGQKPLVIDLKSTAKDQDHVVAVFCQQGRWGAVSKTRHAVLRYREPVYRDIHELVMSYFHEYFTNDGKKTLRSYSEPFNLARFGSAWLIDTKDVWYIPEQLDDAPHKRILSPGALPRLRRADAIEIAAGKLIEKNTRTH